jgi:hypothetical protein
VRHDAVVQVKVGRGNSASLVRGLGSRVVQGRFVTLQCTSRLGCLLEGRLELEVRLIQGRQQRHLGHLL